MTNKIIWRSLVVPEYSTKRAITLTATNALISKINKILVEEGKDSLIETIIFSEHLDNDLTGIVCFSYNANDEQFMQSALAQARVRISKILTPKEVYEIKTRLQEHMEHQSRSYKFGDAVMVHSAEYQNVTGIVAKVVDNVANVIIQFLGREMEIKVDVQDLSFI